MDLNVNPRLDGHSQGLKPNLFELFGTTEVVP
jgi:hypothetical protein